MGGRLLTQSHVDLLLLVYHLHLRRVPCLGKLLQVASCGGLVRVENQGGAVPKIQAHSAVYWFTAS